MFPFLSDNPSYFSLPPSRVPIHPPATVPVPRERRHLQQDLLKKMGASTSTTSNSAPATPTCEVVGGGGARVVNNNSHSTRRSFRTLLRSLSASNPSQVHLHQQQGQQQLLLSRPSKIPCHLASPPAVTSAAQTIQQKTGTPEQQTTTSTTPESPSPKTSTSFINDNMVYYNLPAPPPGAKSVCGSAPSTEQQPFEVCAGDGDARYYNLTPRRRHSIGTFFKERLKIPASTTPPRSETDSLSSPARDCGGGKVMVTGNGAHSREHSNANPSSSAATSLDINANVAEWRMVTDRWHGRKRCNRCCNKGKYPFHTSFIRFKQMWVKI